MEIEIHGLRETQDKLHQLEAKTAKDYTKQGLRAGAQIVADQAQTNVHSRTGITKKAIKVRNGRSKKGVQKAMVILSTRGYPAKKGAYGRYDDQGHFTGKRLSKELTRGGGAKAAYAARSLAAGRKHIEGSFFMERAFESCKEEATETIVSTIQQLVEGGQ